MAAIKRRPQAAIVGQQRASRTAVALGQSIRAARRRRRITQQGLADKTGLSRQRLGDIELGRSLALPMQDWFAVGEALGIYLRFEFGRDPQLELRDAGHLDIQELVVRVAAPAGWKAEWESRSRERWIDVRLEDRKKRRILIVECTNTIGDLGEEMRSSDYKVHEAEQRAMSLATDGAAFAVGLVWVVRDTRANRQLVDRYAGLLESRFMGSSAAWVRALGQGSEMPKRPGLVWSDVKATRIFARRRAG
ncbi:MAG: helix-turn-helix domain-containing protein [Chloroflexota bacterium]